MIPSWNDRLEELIRQHYKNYKPLSLDLSIARTNQEYPLPGDCLQVVGVSSMSASATVRFHKNTNETINLEFGTKIKTVFRYFFITNDAQAGETLDLLVGIDFEIDNLLAGPRAESQAAKIITCTLANTNYAGAAYPCEVVLIKSDVENTGIIWVDFNNAAVQRACLPLDPGDWSRHRLSNVNLINANAEIAGDLLLVVPEV